MKFLISNLNPNDKNLRNLNSKFKFTSDHVGPYFVIKEKQAVENVEPGLNCFIDGYIRDYDLATNEVATQTKSALNYIATQWPVNDSISGSFACTIIDDIKNEIVCCNDSIGVYPLYYFIQDDHFIVSNSLLWIGCISEAEIDETGLFQRTYCPEFANIGTRTILKDTKRLLPGEWIKFNEQGVVLDRKFDNELYRNISNATTPFEYWEKLKKELSYCVGGERNVHIAMSGGMDSRLIISGLPENKEFFCHTYGKDDFYETIVAKRVAELYNAHFTNYSNPELYFPNKKIIEKYTLDTEAIYINSWLEILEAQNRSEREIMLLGDMTESLQGRNLPVKKNWRSFRKYYLGKEDYDLTENNLENFSRWKNSIIDYYTRLLSEKHIERLNINLSIQQLRTEIIKDAESLIARIEAHNLPYMELITELFNWLTHSRIPMGKQILIMDTQFKSFCVPMAVQILRLTSNLHPNLRVNGRFVKSLFSSIDELRPAGNIPTSQIPYISFNSLEVLKVPVWYLRSEIDDFLIKRLMRSKNPEKRYRVLKSFNWAEIYQYPNLEINLRSNFENNYLGEYAELIVKGALSRRDLEQWPLSNVNIINAAALNVELGLLKAFAKS